MLGQRLDHAKAKRRATNTAARTAERSAADFIELAIEGLAVSDPIRVFIFPAALVGVLVGAIGFPFLRGLQADQPGHQVFARLAMDRGGFLSQHLLDR